MWLTLRVLIVLTLFIQFGFVHASPETCTFEVANPNCTEPFAGTCVQYEACEQLKLNGPVDCTNWFCSLRTNCGCFAGLDTSCSAANRTCPTQKPGCAFLVSMFNELNCNWDNYLGPVNQTYVDGLLDLCLAGCNDAWVHKVSFGVIVLVVLTNLAFYF